jgi:putative protease
MVPPSSLNRARRALVEALVAGGARAHATAPVRAEDVLSSTGPSAAPPPPGLFVLCRNLEQAQAALEGGADGVWLDFLALTGTGAAVEQLKKKRGDRAFQIGVAPPRIRKPGEEKIDRFLATLAPDAFLVRGLGALYELEQSRIAPLAIGDFSLNVANRIAAATVLGRGLSGFTPSFDLDGAQLKALLSTWTAPFCELVIHHPMPLFHTEHCVFAALLSDGKDYKSCGRPCERHVVSLRDRVGLDNPVEADVGCRNTVFHKQPQSAASEVPMALRAGVRRFRIELVRENAADVKRILEAYRGLVAGERKPADVFRALQTEEGYGVVRGSLRVLA